MAKVPVFGVLLYFQDSDNYLIIKDIRLFMNVPI